MQDVNKKASGLAKGSLICGIFTIIPLAGFGFSLVAIILGIIDLVKIKNGTSGTSGKKLAITGIVLGFILLPINIILFWIFTGMAMAVGNSGIGASLLSICRSLLELVKVKLGFSG
jgi:hypothetical protein